MGIPPTPLPRHNKTGALLPQCAGFVYRINVQEKGKGWKLKLEAIPHNFKCRYGERGAAAAKQKAQIILCAAKVSAAGGGYSEPKQGQRSQSARGFCPRSTMRVPQPDIIEHFGNADAVPQPPERCLSRQAGIVRCCPKKITTILQTQDEFQWQYRIILSADTASEVRQMLSQKRR